MSRAYPLPRPDAGDDQRFTFGLLLDVGKVIRQHGYPPIVDGMDLVDLQAALFRFLYAAPLLEEDDAEDVSTRPESAVGPRSEGPEGGSAGEVDAVRDDDALLDHLAEGGEPDPADPITGYLRAWVDEIDNRGGGAR